jgi:hypothetical protein
LGFKRTYGEDQADDRGNVSWVSSEELGIEAEGAAQLERCESEWRDEPDGDRAARIHRFEQVPNFGAEGSCFFGVEEMESGVEAVPAGGLALEKARAPRGGGLCESRCRCGHECRVLQNIVAGEEAGFRGWVPGRAG